MSHRKAIDPVIVGKLKLGRLFVAQTPAEDNRMKKLLFMFFVLLFLSIEPVGAQTHAKIGVLLASHGDIDSLAELKPYLRSAAVHMAPVPGSVAGLFSELTWPATRGRFEKIYNSFGIATNYRENSRRQAAALEKQLAARGVQGRVYVGFNLLSPTIGETLDVMRMDGVDTIVVITQGAQFSMATQMNYNDVVSYLRQHTEYKPHVIGINQYTYDERFRTLLVTAIQNDIHTYFPGTTEHVCVLMAFHGLPEETVLRGDRSTEEMILLADYVRDQLPEYQFYYGFLNENVIPFVKWTTPTVVDSAQKMGAAGCSQVLLDARISFTVHPRVALYDLNILARQEIMKRNPYAVVALAKNFDGDPRLAAFFAEITTEALAGRGDLKYLSAQSDSGGHHH